MRRHTLNAAFLAIVFWGARVSASPEYPTIIQAELEMECPPVCTTCHTVDPGVSGTASRPFAQTLKGFGLVEQDEDSLVDALEEMRATATDSDADSFTDESELLSSPPSDPNDGGATPSMPGTGICDAQVNYGCGASISKSTSRDFETSWSSLALLALMLTITRVRRVVRSSDQA